MIPTPISCSRWLVAAAASSALAVGLSGCEGDPFAFRWDDTPVTVLLYSMARPELNLTSGFGFFQGVRVPIESPAATGSWDVALDTRGNELVLLPPGALGVTGAARITNVGTTSFEAVDVAPRDTLVYSASDPVPLRLGDVYVIKTNRREQGAFGAACVYYAKMEPLVIDVAGGALTFRYVTNPICNSIDLVPPR